jgi:AraC family transcriptional regulator, positive regulator of tynA and feaB
VKPHAKVAYWNDLICSLFSPLEVIPADHERFDAESSVDALGPLSFTRIISLPATIEHTDKHVAHTTRREFFLLTPVRGRMLVSHYGHEVLLEEGDFLLGDSAAPSRIAFDEPNQALTVVVPEAALRVHMPVPERVCGLHMSGSRGMGSIVSDMVRKLWAQVEKSGVPPEFGAPIARNLLDVVATSYAMEYSAVMSESAVTSARLAHIKRYVETNLRDPDLTPGAVAKYFGVSPRYVRMIFAGENESLSGYILRRRLEESAQRLASVLWSGHTIAETASAWGFTSMAHFTRVFKEQFGLTPRQYRRQHLPSKGGAHSEPSAEHARS